MKNQPSTIQEEIISTAREMALLLNCTPETIYAMQYKYGLAYLRHYLPCDIQARDILERSKTFWSWFKIQWMHDDQIIMTQDQDFSCESINQRRAYYKKFHSAKDMAMEVKPNSVVLAELRKEVCHVA